MSDTDKLTDENYETSVLTFRDRQAGVSQVYDPESNTYAYNAYCVEKKLLKELFTCEYTFLEEALNVINSEFGSWDLESLEEDSGCGSCAAK